MSVAVDVTLELSRDVRTLLSGQDLRAWIPGMLDEIGAEAASQAQARIADTKASPAGQPWEAWSKRYEKTRHSGQSLLQSKGDLVTSIQHHVEGDAALVGSNLVYAATHQFGDRGKDRLGRKRNIPARQYLGLGPQDARELDQVIEESWSRHRR